MQLREALRRGLVSPTDVTQMEKMIGTTVEEMARQSSQAIGMLGVPPDSKDLFEELARIKSGNSRGFTDE